ncbi:MAG: amidohydrolase family protein [Chloroflexota bacterium]
MTATTASVKDALLRGDPGAAGVRVIDTHAHLGPWFNFRVPHGDADGLLRTMDRAGIRQAWIAAHVAIGPDCRLGNALVAEVVRAHPDRFQGYITVSPHDQAVLRDELSRYYDRGWRLIKIHTGTHRTPADDARYRAMWAFAQEHGLHVLSHAFPSPAALSALAGEHPNATMALGHASSDPRALPAYSVVCAERPNVYLDLCYSVQWRGLLEQMAAGAGAERILYSSDIPFVDPRPQLGRVAFTRLPDDQLRAILGGNAERLWEKLPRR